MGRTFPHSPARTRRLGRPALALFGALMALAMVAGPAFACGGLIGPNGAVNLLRTTTLAGYHDGVEHYVTAFQFAGGGGEFGSIVPLPGVPTSVERGGDWTLQRLVRETDPPDFRAFAEDAAAPQAAGAEVILQVRIDALDITVLRGGANDVGAWATDHGFRLPAGRARNARFLRQPQPDLPGGRVRCRRRTRARAGDRRWDTCPRDDPDRQPVGPAAHPRPGQDRPGDRPGRRLPANRHCAADVAEPGDC